MEAGSIQICNFILKKGLYIYISPPLSLSLSFADLQNYRGAKMWASLVVNWPPWLTSCRCWNAWPRRPHRAWQRSRASSRRRGTVAPLGGVPKVPELWRPCRKSLICWKMLELNWEFGSMSIFLQNSHIILKILKGTVVGPWFSFPPPRKRNAWCSIWLTPWNQCPQTPRMMAFL